MLHVINIRTYLQKKKKKSFFTSHQDVKGRKNKVIKTYVTIRPLHIKNVLNSQQSNLFFNFLFFYFTTFVLCVIYVIKKHCILCQKYSYIYKRQESNHLRKYMLQNLQIAIISIRFYLFSWPFFQMIRNQ